MKKLFLLFLLLCVFQAMAQIPNNGFENWINAGNYEYPNGWATMNTYSAGPFYSCTKSTNHFPVSVGSYSVRVENNTALGQMNGGYGMVVTNAFDYPFQPAFPITAHPTSLTGYYKFYSFNNDTMFVKVVLFKDGLIVMNEDFVAGNNPEWTPFILEFDNYDSADSATILISAFLPTGEFDGPNGNSVLYVDNLNFDNLITSVEVLEQTEQYIFYPNVFSDYTQLSVAENALPVKEARLFDTSGKLVQTVDLISTSNKIFAGQLQQGIYFVQLDNGVNTMMKKIVIL